MWWPRNNLPRLRLHKNLRSKPRLARGDIWLSHTDIETLRGRGRGTGEVTVDYISQAAHIRKPMALKVILWAEDPEAETPEQHVLLGHKGKTVAELGLRVSDGRGGVVDLGRMTVKQDALTGEAVIGWRGNVWLVQRHAVYGIDVVPMGASLIPHCLALAERPDVCAAQVAEATAAKQYGPPRAPEPKPDLWPVP